MATTKHLGLVLLEQAQAQKEITINEALARVDALLNSGVVDRDLATPPGSPLEGDVYIVAPGATGDWAGKTGHVAYYDQIWRFIVPNEGLLLWVNDENVHVVYDGVAWQTVITGSGGGGGGGSAGPQPLVCEGRLTLTAGQPVGTADISAATSVYYTPHVGNRIALYDGSAWQSISFPETSIAVPATTHTIYDVFAYLSSGSLALELTSWTNDTTRAGALVRQHGVLVRSGNATRRYLGSFRTTATSGRTEDSAARRYLYNYYHRVRRPLQRAETAASWTYSTAAYRQANNNSANQLDFLQGVEEDSVQAMLIANASNSSATVRNLFFGMALDSTTSTDCEAGFVTGPAGSFCGNGISREYQVSAGRHIISWMEYGAGADTQTWYGGTKRGISGSVMV